MRGGKRLLAGVTLAVGAVDLLLSLAAAIGVCRQRTYEGQPALELEMAADLGEHGFYPAEVEQSGETLVLDTLAMFRGAVADHLTGQDNGVIAARFHQSLVEGLTQMCVMLREHTGLNLTALSGGVFQNALLVERLKSSLEQQGFEVLTHRLTPPNDGGISLGQVAIAAAHLGRK